MNTMTLDDKAAKAGAIRAALDVGKAREAYRIYNPIWATGLDQFPQLLHNGLINHVLIGRPAGDFLNAVLCNDLMEAVARADGQNVTRLRAIMVFLHNFTPKLCRGSAAAVKAWRDDGGALSIYYDDADLEGGR